MTSLNVLSDLLAPMPKRAGADAADTILYAGTSVSVERRLGQMETLERSESRDLGLRVFVGKRSAIVSATSVDPSGFAALASRAVAMAKVVPEDPYSALCEQAAAPEDFGPLDLVDAHEPDLASLIERAQTAEEAALQVQGVTNSEGGSAGYSKRDVFLATSAGFAGSFPARAIRSPPPCSRAPEPACSAIMIIMAPFICRTSMIRWSSAAARATAPSRA